ncbi:MAG: dTMP kinase [Abditibacteriota bacterium]|nr:dTMP kinase [Abditibacteriota bacterium]
MFISFEGIDGCGKSTQLALLRDWLQARGKRVVATREPGGTRLAETLRETILHGDAISPRAELLLFGAARAQHVAEVIRPALESGAIVLSDRFIDSTIAYQGAGLGFEIPWIRALNSFATGDVQPNLTLIFDVPLTIAQQRRATEKNDRIESRDDEFQARVRQAFLDLAHLEPERVEVLAAQASAAEIHRDVVEVLRVRHIIDL